jgi:hypothetical protein
MTIAFGYGQQKKEFRWFFCADRDNRNIWKKKGSLSCQGQNNGEACQNGIWNNGFEGISWTVKEGLRFALKAIGLNGAERSGGWMG